MLGCARQLGVAMDGLLKVPLKSAPSLLALVAGERIVASDTYGGFYGFVLGFYPKRRPLDPGVEY